MVDEWLETTIHCWKPFVHRYFRRFDEWLSNFFIFLVRNFSMTTSPINKGETSGCGFPFEYAFTAFTCYFHLITTLRPLTIFRPFCRELIRWPWRLKMSVLAFTLLYITSVIPVVCTSNSPVKVSRLFSTVTV